jgi:hypothetical protein
LYRYVQFPNDTVFYHPYQGYVVHVTLRDNSVISSILDACLRHGLVLADVATMSFVRACMRFPSIL